MRGCSARGMAAAGDNDLTSIPQPIAARDFNGDTLLK